MMAARAPSSPYAKTPTSIAAGAVSKKYRRQRARPSPLSDKVRRQLLIKINSEGPDDEALQCAAILPEQCEQMLPDECEPDQCEQMLPDLCEQMLPEQCEQMLELPDEHEPDECEQMQPIPDKAVVHECQQMQSVERKFVIVEIINH